MFCKRVNNQKNLSNKSCFLSLCSWLSYYFFSIHFQIKSKTCFFVLSSFYAVLCGIGLLDGVIAQYLELSSFYSISWNPLFARALETLRGWKNFFRYFYKFFFKKWCKPSICAIRLKIFLIISIFTYKTYPIFLQFCPFYILY